MRTVTCRTWAANDMSLKAIHLIFVTFLSLLCFGCGIWKLRDYAQDREATSDLIFGVGALFVGVVVIIYGRYFLKKLKKFSYL